MENPGQTYSMNIAVTLSQACADLHNTLAALAASKAALDNVSQPLTDDAIFSALDAVRFARRTCDDLTTTIMELAPETSADKMLQSETLSAYFAPPDGNELMLSMLIDQAPSRLFSKAVTRKVWPKPYQDPEAAVLDRDQCIPVAVPRSPLRSASNIAPLETSSICAVKG